MKANVKLIKHLSESIKAITELSRTNNKMADEIDELKCVIEQICIDNDRIKNVLDMKQNDWIEIEKPNKSNVKLGETAVRFTFDKLEGIKSELAMINENWNEWTFMEFVNALNFGQRTILLRLARSIKREADRTYQGTVTTKDVCTAPKVTKPSVVIKL